MSQRWFEEKNRLRSNGIFNIFLLSTQLRWHNSSNVGQQAATSVLTACTHWPMYAWRCFIAIRVKVSYKMCVFIGFWMHWHFNGNLRHFQVVVTFLTAQSNLTHCCPWTRRFLYKPMHENHYFQHILSAVHKNTRKRSIANNTNWINDGRLVMVVIPACFPLSLPPVIFLIHWFL